MELNDIIELIMKRDNISYNEAAIWVDKCREEMQEIISSGAPSLDALEDCIADWLGLEPDYLDVLLPL